MLKPNTPNAVSVRGSRGPLGAALAEMEKGAEPLAEQLRCAPASLPHCVGAHSSALWELRVIFATIAVLIALSALAMSYVYRCRGNARYDNLRQYLRKSWPVFALPNVILYLFTPRRFQRPFVAMKDYPQLASLAQHTSTFREEAYGIQSSGAFDEARKDGTPASYDVGFRTFYKYGWSRFYLKWYGYTHPSAKATCPKTLAILAQYPDIRAAMFAILPPFSKLTPHADPLACSLRYHLGLATPNSPNCYIDVDGNPMAWKDGEAFIFDETYLHFVKNDTDQSRLILMCDIRRPLRFPAHAFNAIYSLVAKASRTPNDERDQRGLASALFSKVSPLMTRGKRLKEQNRRLYVVLKTAINLSLIALIFGGLAGMLSIGARLIRPG